jgi:uncharacterized repeat protein (TIGR03803 family)
MFFTPWNGRQNRKVLVLGCSFVLLLTGYAGAQTMTLSTLYVFRGPPDGALPSSGLVRGQDGVLYGTTVAGGIINDDEILGKNGCGTVYSLSPPTSPDQRWTETVLYAFAGLADGCGPANGVVVGRGGVLYGTTSNSTSGGTAFSLWPPAELEGTWTERVLHTSAGCPNDAAAPSGVAFGSDGVLYGDSFYGGAYSCLPPQGGGLRSGIFHNAADIAGWRLE